MKALSAGLLVAGSLFVLAPSASARQGYASGYGHGHPGGAMRNPNQVDKAALTRLTIAQKRADEAFKKKPKDATVRKAYLDANNRHGLACMYTDSLDRKVKYRMALADFRKVLRVDPKNPVAKQNYDLIVSIYKSMGRPVPG